MPDIRNPIQRYFWDNLSRGGLDLVDGGHVDRLVKYARDNTITAAGATPNAAGAAPTVDTFENGALKELLDNQQWRSLLTDDGVRKLEQALGVQANTTRHGVGRDAPGTVPQGSVNRNFAGFLSNGRVEPRHTAALFNHDYEQKRASVFENPRLPREERAKQVLFLLQDYAKALQDLGGGPDVTNQRKELLTAFFQKPLGKVLGSQDPDDDLLNNAWEIVWGTNAEKAESSFEVKSGQQWIAYMSMNGEFVDTARKIDQVLAAQGAPAKVESYEKKSPLNWIVNEQTGNTKPGSSFKEASAISSTGVDFAVKLLSNEASVGKRTLDPSVDLKVDFYAWGNFVSLNKANGERLVPLHDDTKQPLKVETEEVGTGHWKPVFKDAQGNTVPAAKVTCVIQDRAGKTKGDGEASGSYSASWWGFCDRTAMMGLVTTKYGFPQPEKDVKLNVNGKEFTFTSAEIRQMVGRRLTELFPTTTQAGNRFDDEPDQVHLRDGTVLAGKIDGNINFYRPETQRMGDNMVLVPGAKDGPRGSLRVDVAGAPRDIPADDVVEIRRAGGRGLDVRTGGAAQDTLVLKDGTEVTGTLKSKVSFARATQSGGRAVLKNSPDNPILGDISLKTTRGEDKRVALADVQYLVREDANEILAEEALAYVIRNRGVFCADSWTHSSVANGTRTIEEINRWQASDGAAGKPDWVSGDLASLEGVRGKVQNPDNLLFFSMGNKGTQYGGLRFWVETDGNGMPINSKVMQGQWDFLWGVEGKPDWNAKATFNPHVPNDLVLRLYVNSLSNPEAVKDVLPDNWRTFLQPQA